MNNELLTQKNWWQRHWKWLIPSVIVIILSISYYFSSGMDGITTDLVQAYSDENLYEIALEKVKADKKVIELLGTIEPIDKLAILEGQIVYSKDNQTVNSTIRIVGSKGKAKLDISADRINNEWIYSKIQVRIKNPAEKRQTIKIETDKKKRD